MKKILLVSLVLLSMTVDCTALVCGASCGVYDNFFCMVGQTDVSTCAMEERTKFFGANVNACMVNPKAYSTGTAPGPNLCSNCFQSGCGCIDSTDSDEINSCSQDYNGGLETIYCKMGNCPTIPFTKYYNGYECSVATSCDAQAFCESLCVAGWVDCLAGCGTALCVLGCDWDKTMCLGDCVLICGPRGCELIRTEDTVWDASEMKCIRCDQRKEDENCGDTGGLHISITPAGYCTCCATNYFSITCDSDRVCGTGSNAHAACNPGNNRCESACGAVSACDEVAEGSPCNPTDAFGNKLICDNLPAGANDCTGQKCVNCECEDEDLCGNGVWDQLRGEECEFDANCATGTCVPQDQPNECTCSTCGDGIIDFAAGEECDAPSYGACTGKNSNGIGNKDCLGQGDPDECTCQDCGDGDVDGYEECEKHSDCAGNDCDLDTCKCQGAGPGPAPGSCVSGYGCTRERFTLGQTKTMQDGSLNFADRYCCPVGVTGCCAYCNALPAGWCSCPSPDGKCCPSEVWGWGDGSTFTIIRPDGVTETRCLHDHNKVTYTLMPSLETFTVELKKTYDFIDHEVEVEVCCEAATAAEDCHSGLPGTDEDLDGDIDCYDSDCFRDCGDCRTAECDFPLYGDYEFHCETLAGGCSMDGECLAGQECDVDGSATGNPCTCYYVREMICDNFVDPPANTIPIDDDNDGCANGLDEDCGGIETDCFDAIDNNCDGEIDCNDPECALTAPDCNRCQDLKCEAADNWQWTCKTKPGEECSTPPECWATTKWCNVETCKCDTPPPSLVIEWSIADIACRIIILLQGIAAAIATLMIVYSGIKWIGSGIGNPATKTEASETIKSVFIGLIIIIIALQFINYMFGNELGTVTCPTTVDWHNMVIICGTPYMCGNIDTVCPEDFGVACDIHDPDC